MKPNPEYTVTFENLNGGINLAELDYRLPPNESPEMENLLWKSGALNCRPGQNYVSETLLGTPYACHGRKFHGKVISHCGTKLYADDVQFYSGVPENAGTFFEYLGNLYYKNKGAYLKISAGEPESRRAEVGLKSKALSLKNVDDPLRGNPLSVRLRLPASSKEEAFQSSPPSSVEEGGAAAPDRVCREADSLRLTADSLRLSGSFTAAPVTPYVPTIIIDADPSTGAGSFYQSENRLSPDKRIVYNAQSSTVFKLPVNATSIVRIEGTYTSFTYSAGTLTFLSPVSGEIAITYRLANPDAYSSIMDCDLAVVYSNISVVFAGCPAQPNAYFWNGNTNLVMDAGYFPMEQYNFAGDASDPVTAFGLQQSFLVIFKERSIGRTSFGIEAVDGRDFVDLPYTPINAGTGCLRNTVQLVENNLVWADEKGIYFLSDSSEASENTVIRISKKLGEFSLKSRRAGEPESRSAAEVNPSVSCADSSPYQREPHRAFLESGKAATTAEGFTARTSFNDGSRYWLVLSTGEAFSWDYRISGCEKPSWFYLTGIEARCLCYPQFITTGGRLSEFTEVCSDFGRPVEKVYRFATQLFGGYDRIKNINSVLLSIRSDTNSVTKLCYITDSGSKAEPYDLINIAYRLVPRDLSFRCLAGRRFAKPFRRRPRCRRIHHFTMRLTNSELGQDLSIVSAQIIFNYQGRFHVFK